MASQNPIVWFEIYVKNMKRAQTFYEEVFDVKLSELPTPDTLDGPMQMMAFPSEMDGPGAAGVLVKMEGFEAGNNSTLVYFRSDDCQEQKRIEKAGGTVCQTKQSLGEHGFMVLAKDTEGNMFGIHSMK
ncbi:VOC family protein [Subsaximicrobium wynnwilliamsii]|uniref:VOC family protein n=1 Tax=Subsaximicrobium wynnwilliamsii TaxID=291179 RepID=A0A5C6ZJE1_9FLAO|nr:VOC family protein [Subsaximicrobium wynnwilliamsii]TXD84385.1 VOC family protein [Subsaximicrobium wynnwilliamsii]TXD90066.1 VOC family protein [Subsaximicrobium wynnwilliamsii]TXE04118.1 VOC family protein [Subsaximicrobium wynnwilliamsii]